MSQLVTFVLGEREYATPLSVIREVVRLEGLADLPGMTPPLAGVLDLRGTALPVLDLGDVDAVAEFVLAQANRCRCRSLDDDAAIAAPVGSAG